MTSREDQHGAVIVLDENTEVYAVYMDGGEDPKIGKQLDVMGMVLRQSGDAVWHVRGRVRVHLDNKVGPLSEDIKRPFNGTGADPAELLERIRKTGRGFGQTGNAFKIVEGDAAAATKALQELSTDMYVATAN